MNNIKAELQKIVNRYGLGQSIQATSVCQLFRQEASGIFPAEILGPMEVISFSNGLIKIGVPSSNYAQTIHWREPELLERINKKSSQRVERIKIVIKETGED